MIEIVYDAASVGREGDEETISIPSAQPGWLRNYYFPQALVGDARYRFRRTSDALGGDGRFIYVMEFTSPFHHKLFADFNGVMPELARFVPTGVLEAVRRGQATLVLSEAQEIRPDLRIFDALGKWMWFFDLVQAMVDAEGLPPKRVWLLEANFALQAQFRDWLEARRLAEEEAFVFRALVLFDTTTRQVQQLLAQGRGLAVDEDDRGNCSFRIRRVGAPVAAGSEVAALKAELASGAVRPKTFLCMNNVPRNHRKTLVFFLVGRGHAERGLISLNTGPGDIGVEAELLSSATIDAAVRAGAEAARGLLPLRLDLAPAEIEGAQWATYGLGADWPYRSSYISIVAETYLGKGRYLTEKLFKPIAKLQPFIVVGPPGTLSLLRARGYRTFDRIIDESYDEIEDDARRFAAVLEVVDGIAGLSPTEARDLFAALEEEITHNHRHLLESETDMDRALREMAA